MTSSKRYISPNDYELLKKMYPSNLEEIITKINNNYPVQYLIGYVNFYGYQINVDERVLIPRYETEGLVEELLKQIKTKKNLKILDIGTGSGCIAIALSKELNKEVDTIDISKESITLAKENAIKNNADVHFILGDIKNYKFTKKYNVLISNPPYVSYEEEVDPATKYEPQNAIFANKQGLEFYEIILKRSIEFLEKQNIIAFEIGQNQSKDITDIAKKIYPSATIYTKKDLSNKDRYLFIINE